MRHAYTRLGPASDLPRTRLSFRGTRSDPFQTRLSLVGPAWACFGSTFHSIRLQLQRGSRKKRYMHRTHARTHARVRVRARVRARTHACTHGGTQALKHAGTQARRHAGAQACRHANTRACTHARLLHKRTQTGAHTQAHTHTHTRKTHDDSTRMHAPGTERPRQVQLELCWPARFQLVLDGPVASNTGFVCSALDCLSSRCLPRQT